MSNLPVASQPSTSQSPHVESKPASPSRSPLGIGCGTPACCGGHAPQHSAAPTTHPIHSGSGGTTSRLESSSPLAKASPNRNVTPPRPAPHRRPSFLREFLANPIATAAIAPSSRHLAAAMLKGLDFASLRTIVEFGPGTGVFTRATLEALRAAHNTDAVFLALELNPRLATELQAEFAPIAALDPRATPGQHDPRDRTHTTGPRVHIRNDNALNIDRALADSGRPHADLIISGLGWPSIPAGVRDAILEKTAAALAPGRAFRTFGYHIGLSLPGAWGFRKTVRRLFSRVTISPVVWRNLPPAFVYECVK